MRSSRFSKNMHPPRRPPLEDRLAQIKQVMEGKGLRPLIQQVAWVIFFEYEDIPTGNHIYTLLQTGSITTYVSEVKAFWETLREQVKDAQAVADIPTPLTQKIAREMSAVWQMAQSLANEDRSADSLTPSFFEKLTPLSRLSARMKSLELECDELKIRLKSSEVQKKALTQKLVALHGQPELSIETMNQHQILTGNSKSQNAESKETS